MEVNGNATMRVGIRQPALGTSADCEPILRSLRPWFGIEEANAQYLRDIETLPTFLAEVDGGVVGFLTIREHSEYAAEIHIIGVRPEMHRRGVGRALLLEAERYLRERGIEYLQVKTLSASHPDEGYARTRAFYEAVGFRPLEELPDLWGPANPCLLMVKRL
jgi:ribosomal protein S18 acetylase RimI-like enzyme